MCMSPNEVYYNWNTGKYQFSYTKECSCSLRGIKSMVVPCGKCPECKAKWRTQLAQRVRYEMMKYPYDKICFLTLTVNDDYINKVFPDGSLDHAYFQKFMKRLRRHLEYHGFTGKIKYLCSGEYGELNGRPHFHVILFGWKPTDLRFRGRSQKGYVAYKSDMLESIWGAGFVDVGDVTEHTAPYMVKYIAKFGEVKGDEFTVNGKNVRKPYIVYPKKILGIDYFLENFKQILTNGYILDSRGQKHGIPRSYLKYCENCDDSLIQELYNEYKLRINLYLEQHENWIHEQGYWYPLEYHVEQGMIRRAIYDSFKNKHR